MSRLLVTSQLRTIGLWEPWAAAIREGHKRIETRSWPIRSAKWLVIIATTAQNSQIDEAKHKFAHLGLTYHPGNAVALARVVCCKSTGYPDYFGAHLSKKERSLGNYEDGRYAIVLADVIELYPFPAKARQRLGVPDVDMKRELLRQLKEQGYGRRAVA